jgi:hypothetical protein
MEKRDLLIEEAERLGRVLGEMICDLLKIRHEKTISSNLEVNTSKLKFDFDFDLHIIINSDEETVSNYLSEKRFSYKNTELLIDYLRIIASNIILKDKKEALKILQRALYLYVFLDSRSKNFSFYRVEKEKDIKNIIKNELSDLL